MDRQHAQRIIRKIYDNEPLPIDEVKWVCSTSTKLLLDEPTVLDVSSPVTVVGDVHGELETIFYIFDTYGSPKKNRYIFLGDYVDRGPKSLYTILFLLSIKIKLGKDFHMIRGNHEDIKISMTHQFRDEIIKTYGSAKLMDDFDSVFKSLPLAVLVNNTILCVHGGLGPAVRTVESIREIKRPYVLTDQDPMYDIVWADPQKNIEDWGNGRRSTSCSFGETPLLEFFERSNITAMIRGHECVPEGYLYSFGPEVNFVTLFSAPNYGNLKNKGAVLFIDDDGKYTFHTYGPYLTENES